MTPIAADQSIPAKSRGFGAPGRYFQGPGLIQKLPRFSSQLGGSAYLLSDPFFENSLVPEISTLFLREDSSLVTSIFYGEVTDAEILRVKNDVASKRASVVIGLGGGKTIDTIKAVASELKLPLIIVPTTASTDAPCSSLSVIYSEDGHHSGVRWYTRSPDIVLVDSELILGAPIKYLVAGIGDALSTYFETKANAESHSRNYINFDIDGGYLPSITGTEIARVSYEILRRDSIQAIEDVIAGRLTNEVENIIEVNTLLSGLGFENNGCAGAHSINDGITAAPGGAKVLHGERVAFGVIVQLIAENKPVDFVRDIAEFCLAVGLPVTLGEMKIESTEENLELIAKGSMHSNWSREPFDVTWEKVKGWIRQADELGMGILEASIS
jgi:glycerol dehydrogenase